MRTRAWRLRPGPAIVLVTSTLAACGGGHHAASRPLRPVAATVPTTTTTQPAPRVAPLTGLPDPNGDTLGRPALSVKIENTPPARPQAGLEAADVVYEQVVEGNITRFLAVFDSTLPDVIGPVRSARAMDPDLFRPLGGVFVYSGGIPATVALVRSANANPVDETGAGPAMFRDRARFAPHNLFGHGPALDAKGGRPVPAPALFAYLGAGETFAGDPALSVHVGFASGFDPTYTFDAASRTWKRSYGLAPFLTRSGAQVAPTNVVVQFVRCCVPSTEAGANITTGTGDAWVFVDGKVARGTWTRPDASKPIEYVDAAGRPIKLAPGRTWVELVPVGSAVDVR